ncbi:unnamed protein product [Rotaria sp. Silwood1]|nr:unnamed protein product [Rotaria sp. Silwood1]
MSNKSTRIKANLISNIRAKLASNLHIHGTATSGGDCADDKLQIEGNIVDLQMSMAKEDLAKDNEKGSCELATDFTRLQLQSIHKIMILKFALNQAL